MISKEPSTLSCGCEDSENRVEGAKGGMFTVSSVSGYVGRLEPAHARTVEMVEHLGRFCKREAQLAVNEGLYKVQKGLNDCGHWLLFRDYYGIAKVRLVGGNFCKIRLLCPLCAIRWGGKALQVYLSRYETIMSENPHLKAYLVTLTVKNGVSLLERFEHLQKSIGKLWSRRTDFLRRGWGSSQLAGVEGMVFSYEFTRSKAGWHPHVHMIVLCEEGAEPDFPYELRPVGKCPQCGRDLATTQRKSKRCKCSYCQSVWGEYEKAALASGLAQEWLLVTGDSFIVDIRPLQNPSDPKKDFVEVFKYALKFSDLSLADNLEAFRVLRGRRLLDSRGCFRGVKVPEKLTEDFLEDLPYMELFYRYLGERYVLQRTRHCCGGEANC